jgi:dolichol-phosphate mannosyltransferase
MARAVLGVIDRGLVSADLLFIDDNSPDGTGAILDRIAAEDPRLSVIHRAGKEGIGTAHQAGIARAYELGYRTLVTMDCDFTHSPEDVPRMLARFRESGGQDVCVGSRYLRTGSLPGWNLLRRFLTNFGHFLTERMLGMTYDATGAFRVYNLSTIPREIFSLIKSRGYSFFFESLFLLHRNGYRIAQLPIVLPARTYGHSKMSFRDAARSARQVFEMYYANSTNSGQFMLPGKPPVLKEHLVDPQGWDSYWGRKDRKSGVVYEVIAAIYRNGIIKRRLNWALRQHFAPGARLLHAGCGSGQVDTDLQREMRLTAIDISPAALDLYRRNNPRAERVEHASIFDLPFADDEFDGAYNLGVVEHFTSAEIDAIFKELRRVLKPGGRVVIFWPHRWASSVIVLKLVHWVLIDVLGKQVQLHPPEISLVRSRHMAIEALERAGLEPLRYTFDLRDLFVQAVVVGRKAG